MKRTLNKWLAALLAACLLLTAPVALMEEAIEAAPEEIVFDLGEVPEAEADLEAEVSDDIEAQADELAPMDLQVLADEAGDELSAEAIPVSDNQWTADGKMIFDFDGGTYTLVKGTSFPLVYADGSTSATGYTSNDGVAVIENNVLKANGLGEAIVSVLTQQGHTYIARFYVENPATPQDVTRPQRVDIMDDSGKVLNGQQLTMKVGDTITLQAKAYYDDHTEGLYLGGNYGQSLKSESLFEDEPGLYRFTAYAPGVASVSVYASGISVTVNIKVVSAAAAQTDGVSIASTFPDEAFRKYITYNYDINEDGFLSASEIEKVYRIDLDKSNGGNIKSVAGIGTFTALDMLSIYDNDYITDVDLNQCANLTEVALGNNKALKSVNASQCKNVLVFSFDNNPSMTTLDVSGCTAVEELVVVDCPLTTLNMGSKPSLVMLELNCDSYLTVNIKQCGKLTAAAGGAYVVMDGDMYTLENENEKYEDISISFRKNVILEGISPKIPSAHDILVSGPDYVRLDGKDVNVQYNAYPIMYGDGGRIYWKISSGAAISEKGLATFSKPGTYTITVSCKYGGKKEYKVTVEGKGAPDPTVPDSITLTAVGYPMTVDPNTQVDSYTVELSAGKVQLKAVCNPSATASQEVTWSFEGPTGYVTIAKDGAVTLKKTGEVMIVATSAKTKTVSKKILLNIVDNSVPKEISITAEGYAKNADGTYTVDVAKPTVKLKAACLPAIAVQTVTWKVTPSSFASITKDGVLTVKKQGEITVVATSTKDKTVTGEVELNIEDHSIPKDIEVTAPGYTKNAEGHYVVDVAKPSVSLKAVCTPDEAVKTVTWKVVPTSFASISKDGVLTLKKQGQVTVIATSTKDKTVTGEAVLDIEDHSIPKELNIDAVPEDTLNKSLGKYTLSVSVTPNEAVKTVTWKSSASSVASVDKNGVLTLKKQGYVTLTATSTKDKTVSDIITLFVKDDTIPEQIDVTAPDYAKNADDQYVVDVAKPTVNLKAIVKPASAIQTVNWKVSPSGYATVKNGVLTLKKKGVVTVTATSTKDKAVFGSAVFNILDNSIPDKLIFADVPTQLNKSQGTYKLTFTTEPAIADKTVTWKSSAGSVASINKDGVITLKKQGTVTFTATPKKNKVAAASVTIFVKDNTIPTSLTITPAGPTTLEKGKTLQLTVKADTPEADATVTWKSSNSVVKVNKDGLVTADKKKTGTATITATSKKDKTVTQTITITVQ